MPKKRNCVCDWGKTLKTTGPVNLGNNCDSLQMLQITFSCKCGFGGETVFEQFQSQAYQNVKKGTQCTQKNKTVVGTPHKNYIIIHLWHNHKESKHMGLNPSNSGLLFTTRVTVLLQNVGLIQNSAVCTCVRDKQIAAKQCFFG